MTLIRLTYFSENHLNGRGGELLAGVREIIKTSPANNQSKQVTGALLVSSG